jgi:hypothetical protein
VDTRRVVIPSVLAVTMLVAGIFAVLPVEKAVTIHETLQASERDSTGIYPDTGTIGIPPGGAIVLVDNAGVGGTSDVEVTWSFSDSDCQVVALVEGATSVTNLVDDNALDSVGIGTLVNHKDVANAELVAVVALLDTCAMTGAVGDFITVSTVRSVAT